MIVAMQVRDPEESPADLAVMEVIVRVPRGTQLGDISEFQPDITEHMAYPSSTFTKYERANPDGVQELADVQDEFDRAVADVVSPVGDVPRWSLGPEKDIVLYGNQV